MLLQQVRLSIIRPIINYYLVTFREATDIKNRIEFFKQLYILAVRLYILYILCNKDVKTTAKLSH